MKRISKTETGKQVKEFFENIEGKTAKEVKKIKKVAMSQNFPLKDLRKKFCSKCLSPFGNSKVRIKNKTKSIECKNCGRISRWKLK